MSWLGDLLSALGQGAGQAFDAVQSGAETAMDETSAIMSGIGEETFNPNNRSSYNRDKVARESMFEQGLDSSRLRAPEGEASDFAASFLDAPFRAVDRASKYYTGDELLVDRPDMHVPAKSRRSMLPEVESAEALQDVSTDSLSAREKIKAAQQSRMSPDEGRAQAALNMLKRESGADTASFVSRGNTVMGSDPGMDRNMGSFSRSLPTVVAQQQVKRLGQLGVPADMAKIMVDNANGDEARNAIMQLSAKAMVPVQDRVASILQGAREESAKATNPKEVIKWTVAQLRSAGLSDPQIKVLLMSMAPEQAPQ
jgi:hypothetical protein